MKLIPILFSTPMVSAIMSGNKCMTRRTVKPNQRVSSNYDEVGKLINKYALYNLCPYGQTGDVLWVKEEYYQFGHWVKNGKTKTGRQKWSFVGDSEEIRYFDNKLEIFRTSMNSVHPDQPQWYKRLSRFMPFKYARTFLRRTGTKVERLQDISEQDAKGEGITYTHPVAMGWKNYMNPALYFDVDKEYLGTSAAAASFFSLWVSINGEESWKSNPWVWVVIFARITNANEIVAIRKQWSVKHTK